MALDGQAADQGSTTTRPAAASESPCTVRLGPRPIQDPSDPAITLVANARIDNLPELRSALGPRSPDYLRLPQGDALAILAAYRRWGKVCPAHLIGDFAFVIWDERQQCLLAACDGMNMRPLHYVEYDGSIFLASDAEQLLRLPDKQFPVSELALALWVSGYPDPTLPMFEGIQRLKPGHALFAQGGRLEATQFWDIDPKKTIRYKHLHEYEEHLREVLKRAVSDRMRTDKPVIATQMSGGMDSTTVTALANEIAKEQNKELLVVSHTYAKTPDCDETDLIMETLAFLGIENYRLLPVEKYSHLPFHELFPPTIESPGIVLSPRYFEEMEVIRDAGADVLLTGQGGDEMTWGHSLTYSGRLLRGDVSVIPEVVLACKRLKMPVLSTSIGLFLRPLAPSWIKAALGRHPHGVALPKWLPVDDGISQDLIVHVRNSRNRQLRGRALQARYDALTWSTTINPVRSYSRVAREKRTSSRHPFFDRRVLDFSFAIPADLWAREGTAKYLLRRSMADVLPPAVRDRTEKTHFAPYFSGLIENNTSQHFTRSPESVTRSKPRSATEQTLLRSFESIRESRGSSTSLCALAAYEWSIRVESELRP